MQLLLTILVYPILWLISILPHRLFYGVSDCICFLVFYVVGYRKNIVLKNLELTLPEKSEAELLKIRKEFYKHMCDMFMEMIKSMTISEEEVKKKYHVKNIEVLQEIEKEKSILIPCAHYANWEWNISINLYLQSKGFCIYQKIENPYVNKFVRKLRSKWNTTPITDKQTIRSVFNNEKNNIRGVYGMVSDQSPPWKKASYWSAFMGVKVPIHTGVEQLARKLNLAVVFLKVTKVKRGYYEAEFIPIAIDGKETASNEITDQFLRLVENQIEEEPAYYFWTHRRWKHRDKVPENFQ